MQFWKITESTRLSDLSNLVGSRNVDQVLHYNDIQRAPNLGQVFKAACDAAIDATPDNIDYQRKITILNGFAGDYDVFETAALSSEDTWKLLSKKNTFPMYLVLPETIVVPDSRDIMGNGQGVPALVFKQAMDMLKNEPHVIDPNIFNNYSSTVASKLIDAGVSTARPAMVFQSFNIPWGDVRLYSSLDDDYVDFPVYPEQVSDGRKANYTEMPDLLYQYEPWEIYSSSGPRTVTYQFDFHRDMWNGDHNLGGANHLIRFCQAQCYPEFTGSSVNTAIVTLYVKGSTLISGVLTDVSTDWDGPIGHDGWYLHCKLSLTITEVASRPLNHTVIKNMGVIG